MVHNIVKSILYHLLLGLNLFTITQLTHISFTQSLWVFILYIFFYFKAGLFFQRMNYLLETYKILKSNILAHSFSFLIGFFISFDSLTLWYFFLLNITIVPLAIYLFKRHYMQFLRENVILLFDTPNPPSQIIDYFSHNNPYGFRVVQALPLSIPLPTGHETVLIAASQTEKLLSKLTDLLEDRPNVYLIPATFDLPIFTVQLLPSLHQPQVLFLFQNPLLLRFNRWIKRGFDLAFSSILFFLFAPLMIVIALAIFIETSHNPIFIQYRLGLKGKKFKIYKFRTMVADAEKQLQTYLQNNPSAKAEYERYKKLRNDPRITKIGSFLRKTSIDELPQLFNVIKGDMSLVGPRPILPDEKELFGEHFRYYIQVRPGITGLWQVSGRNDLPFEDRIRLDTLYVRNWTLDLDFMILLKTVIIVLKREGSY